MAHPGGGAEAHARFKQYEYRANSSLVLTTDSRPALATPMSQLGSRSLCGGRLTQNPLVTGRTDKPPELEEKLKKSKKKKEREPALDVAPPRSKKRRLQEESVLTSSDVGVYQPKTKETRAAYEIMLSIIKTCSRTIKDDIGVGNSKLGDKIFINTLNYHGHINKRQFSQVPQAPATENNHRLPSCNSSSRNCNFSPELQKLSIDSRYFFYLHQQAKDCDSLLIHLQSKAEKTMQTLSNLTTLQKLRHEPKFVHITSDIKSNQQNIQYRNKNYT